MKKIVLIAAFGIAMGLTSCVKDDVEDLITDVNCQGEAAIAESTVKIAIDAYDEVQTNGTCNTLKSAIEDYRAFSCVADDAYSTEYTALGDCSS